MSARASGSIPTYAVTVTAARVTVSSCTCPLNDPHNSEPHEIHPPVEEAAYVPSQRLDVTVSSCVQGE